MFVNAIWWIRKGKRKRLFKQKKAIWIQIISNVPKYPTHRPRHAHTHTHLHENNGNGNSIIIIQIIIAMDMENVFDTFQKL